VHHQKEERAVSEDQVRGKFEDGITQNGEGLKRRDLLLGGSSLFLAASALSGVGFVTTAQAQQPAPAPQTGQRPNIVFILVDNVGWGSFGAYGGTIATPRIDKLASEGIRFNNYNVEAQCTPSRSAILTGRHPVRSGTSSIPLPGQGVAGLTPWEYTTAELLSDAGYATALYGKWHLGDTQGRLPNDQGFDEWWGIKNSWDEAGYTAYPLFKESGLPVPMIWEGKKGEPSRPVMPLDLKVRPIVDEKYIVPKTVEFIKRNAAAKKAFYVYVGYSEAHPPMIGNPDFVGKSTKRGGPFADVIAEMDYRVGQILDAIKEAGIDDNTIVILSSDNGSGGYVPQLGGSTNGPWRGDFTNTPFEGSMRVPAMVRWPGKVPAGVVTEEMLAAVGLVAHTGRDGGCIESRAQGSTDRRRRRLGLHAGQKRYDRPRQLHVLRHGRRAYVDQVEDLQDDLPLHGDSSCRQTLYQAAVANDVRPQQRSARGQQYSLLRADQRLDNGAEFQAHR
jgi:Sulfatase